MMVLEGMAVSSERGNPVPEVLSQCMLEVVLHFCNGVRAFMYYMASPESGCRVNMNSRRCKLNPKP